MISLCAPGRACYPVKYFSTGQLLRYFELTVYLQFDMEDKSFCGDVAQLGERGVRNAEVRGSIPLIST